MTLLRHTQHIAPALLRRYSTSSALAYDYEAEVEYEPKLKVGSACVGPTRGVQWVVIGAKKHVYAGKLSKLLEVPLISLSSLLRPDPRSSLYKQIAKAVNERKRVPEEIIFTILSKRLEEGYYRGETGFILYGIPRNRMQAEILDQITDIDLVVNFKCAKEINFVGIDRQLHEKPGPSTSAREENLRIYTEQGKPLEDYYRKQKKLLDFHIAGAASETTWKGLLAALHLQYMSAVKSSQKLKS